MRAGQARSGAPRGRHGRVTAPSSRLQRRPSSRRQPLRRVPASPQLPGRVGRDIRDDVCRRPLERERPRGRRRGPRPGGGRAPSRRGGAAGPDRRTRPQPSPMRTRAGGPRTRDSARPPTPWAHHSEHTTARRAAGAASGTRGTTRRPKRRTRRSAGAREGRRATRPTLRAGGVTCLCRLREKSATRVRTCRGPPARGARGGDCRPRGAGRGCRCRTTRRRTGSHRRARAGRARRRGSPTDRGRDPRRGTG